MTAVVVSPDTNPIDDRVVGAASVYTRYAMGHARVPASCGGHRQLTDPSELDLARRHAMLWHAATVVPYHVCDGHDPHCVSLTHTQQPSNSPTPDITQWHTGAYTVHTAHGAATLRALASQPVHMPAESAIRALGDLGVVRVARHSPPNLTTHTNTANVKVWAPDATVGTVIRVVAVGLLLLLLLSSFT